MKFKSLKTISTLKASTLTLALFLPLCAFAQKDNKVKTTEKEDRVEIEYKQRHSKAIKNQDFYADGIKIKRDLSLIDKAREARILDMDEIPSDELYGGIWNSKRVNAYSDIQNKVDTFKVDLTNFVMPTLGHVTSNYGPRRRRFHHGIDLKVQTGDTIYAAFDGKVRLCQFERRGYGNYVVIRHTNGLETVYGHLSGFIVSEDDVVKAGDPIALGGNTGRSTGSHLHLEFRFLGQPIDPNKIVDFNNKVCHKDYFVVNPNTFNYVAKNNAKNARSGATNKYVSGKVNYHRVKQGDTLSKIAKRYGTTIQKLCKLNNLSQKTTLRLGQSIRLS